jgi:hypothetical protein
MIVEWLIGEDASQFPKWLVVIEHRRRHAIGGGDLQAPPQILGVSGLVPHGADSGLQRQVEVS